MFAHRIVFNTTASVAVDTAAVQLLPANQARVFLLIQNVSANNLGVTFDGSVPAIGSAGTFTIAAGATLRFDSTYAPVNVVRAIASAAASGVSVIEA